MRFLRFEIYYGEPQVLSHYLSCKYREGRRYEVGFTADMKVGLRAKEKEGCLRDLIEEMARMPIFRLDSITIPSSVRQSS